MCKLKIKASMLESPLFWRGFRRGVQGSTLIETLVAMVILMMCFGIASMIYVNVLTSDNNRQRFNAHLLLNNIALQTKEEKKFIDEKTEEGEWEIKKEFTPYKSTEDVLLLTIKVQDKSGKTIAEHKELIQKN